MKVLHAPFNIAGQATLISRAQRSLGIESDVLIFDDNAFHYEYDINLQLSKKNTPQRILTYLKCLYQTLKKYDILHFHFGRSLLPWSADLPLLKLIKKKSVMHYWGSDVIQTDVALRYTLLSKELLQEIYPKIDNEEKRKKLARINRRVSMSIVGDPALLPYLAQARVIPKVIDVSKIPFIGSEDKKILTIVHAPTNRNIKGTELIEKEITKIKKCYPINYFTVENKPHKQALELYKTADIVIDDVLQGPYGILAMECMAMGKPVMTRIDPAFIKFYPNLPIINTDRSNIYTNLIRLIENHDLRRELGLKGRAYVEQQHDSIKIAKQLMSMYQEIH